MHMCDMTHSYVYHDSFIRVTCLIHMWVIWWLYYQVAVFERKRAPCLVALLRKMTCDLRHPMSLRHPVSRVPLEGKGDSYGDSYDSRVTYTARHVWNESCHTYKWDMSHMWMRHVTHMSESYGNSHGVQCKVYFTHTCVNGESYSDSHGAPCNMHHFTEKKYTCTYIYIYIYICIYNIYMYVYKYICICKVNLAI